MSRSVTLTALSVTAAGALALAAPTAASASGGHGNVRVHVTVDGKSTAKFKICATDKRYGSGHTLSIEGHCGTSNSSGIATLSHVPTGKWFVTDYFNSTPEQTADKKVRVRSGHTTSFTFAFHAG